MIVVAAAKFETEPLRNKLAPQVGIDWLCCGVGVIAAAAAGQRLRISCRGREVIFIGSCGTFGKFKKIMLCRAQALHWSPTCARTGLSYAVDATPPLSCPSSSCYNDLPVAEVFCAPNISLTNTLPAAAPAGILCVENVEAYAFLSQLGDTASSVSVLLAITNAVGKDAHQQWQQHHAQAARLTAAYVMQRRFTSFAT